MTEIPLSEEEILLNTYHMLGKMSGVAGQPISESLQTIILKDENKMEAFLRGYIEGQSENCFKEYEATTSKLILDF